jgi:hypothetical protein
MAAASLKDFYVYIHRRATNGSVFYVGKGHGSRAESKFGRNAYWHRVTKKHGFKAEIVLAGLQEWFAFELERDLIAYYGRDSLCNLTDGGDGTAGVTPWNLGKPHKPETRAKLSQAAKLRDPASMVRVITEAAKKNLSEKAKGRRHTDAARLKMSAQQQGRKHSDETKKKISESKVGVKREPFSEEWRHKLGNSFRGKKRPEHAEKLRAIWRQRQLEK